jgi:Icc-related predicted phosphoesterase
MLNKPLLFVFGNHNLKYFSYYKNFKSGFFSDVDYTNRKFINRINNGGIYIGGKIKKIKGILIAGLGGSKRYNNGLNQFTEVGMFFYILRLIPKLFFNKIFHGRYLDILLTHAPPKGIHDLKDRCHSGFKIFLWFIKTFRPKYFIHGHVHLLDLNKKRVTDYLNTRVINAYRYTVVDTEEKL